MSDNKNNIKVTFGYVKTLTGHSSGVRSVSTFTDTETDKVYC